MTKIDGVQGAGNRPVKLTKTPQKDGIEYKTPNGIRIFVPKGEKTDFSVNINDKGEYRIQGLNNAEVTGSSKLDVLVFDNSSNNSIMVANDGNKSEIGDEVVFINKSENNRVLANENDRYIDFTKSNSFLKFNP